MLRQVVFLKQIIASKRLYKFYIKKTASNRMLKIGLDRTARQLNIYNQTDRDNCCYDTCSVDQSRCCCCFVSGNSEQSINLSDPQVLEVFYMQRNKTKVFRMPEIDIFAAYGDCLVLRLCQSGLVCRVELRCSPGKQDNPT